MPDRSALGWTVDNTYTLPMLDLTIISNSTERDRNYRPSKQDMDGLIKLYKLGQTNLFAVSIPGIALIDNAINPSNELARLLGWYYLNRIIFATTNSLLGLRPK